MGEVINKRAAASDIHRDLDTTIQAANARGGYWESRSKERLVPVQTARNVIKKELTELLPKVSAAQAKLDVHNDSADAVLFASYDEFYNLLGRRSNDPYLTAMYPGGASDYAYGDVTSQPQRMEFLATLLDAGFHPGIPLEKATATAKLLRAEKEKLSAALEELNPILVRAEILEKCYTTLARVAQIELANAKRFWKSMGESETSVHEVIPDRPS